MRDIVRVLSAGILSAGAWGTLTVGGAQAANTVPTAADAGNPVPVIVFLGYQPPLAASQPGPQEQRAQQITAAQAPYLSQLRQLHATNVKTYTLVNAFAATVPAQAVSTLAATPGVAQVISDSPIAGPDPGTAMAGTGDPAASPAAERVLPGACARTGADIEQDGLTTTRTESLTKKQQTARSLGYTGAGVTVGFLADGIDPSNANLMRRGRSVVVDYRDFSGDGPRAPTAGGVAFGDASAIAGQGRVYNTQGFSAQSPRSACDVRVEGTAPGASLVALKVFNRDDVASTSGFLQAIDYAVTKDRVNVLDESFGATPFTDAASLKAVERFNDAAEAAGVTIVVAGDTDPGDTIGSPADGPGVLSVGATTAFGFYAQTDYAAADLFAATGWLDDNISSLGSGGYTPSGGTVDMVAPGDLSFASCTAQPRLYADCVNFAGKASAIEASGGTSQSAAMVAGAAALVIQSYRKAHGGATPTPAQVRGTLLSAAVDLGAPVTEQGAGMLNSLRAVELAAWMPNCDPVGESLRMSASQLNAVASPGTRKTWTVSVTNTGAKKQVIAVTGRTVGAPKVVATRSVTLSDSKSPHFTNWSGAKTNYGEVHFRVPRGAADLDASITWAAGAAGLASTATSAQDKTVQFVLIDPRGRFAADSAPQGVGGYGAAQVLHPVAGRWTAVVFSDASSVQGTTGKISFGASVSSYLRFGTVSPASLTLAPGKSRDVTISAVLPAGAGESSGALVLNDGYGPVSVPVTMRGIVDAVAPGGAPFSGELTGGNGRAPGQGQVAAYQFNVPATGPHVPLSLAANVVLASPGDQVTGYLIAPDGLPAGYASNYLTTGFTSAAVPVETPERQLTVYSTDTMPGTWTLIVGFTEPAPGYQPHEAFRGRIQFDIPRARRGGLPESASKVLARGKAVSYRVQIKNTGAAPEDIFLDPRLDSLSTYTLQPQDRVTGIGVPLSASAEPPEWIVPAMSQRVHATATSAVPVMFDFGPYPGGLDQASTAGTVANGTFPGGAALPAPVTQGLWFAVPSRSDGPSASAGAAAGSTVGMAMSATTQTFDKTVTETAGDFWRFAVRPLAATASYDLYVIDPGQTRTFVVTIKPTAALGTVVRGVLYVDAFADTPRYLGASTVAALRYVYKVG
jgi:Subtilase family